MPLTLRRTQPLNLRAPIQRVVFIEVIPPHIPLDRTSLSEKPKYVPSTQLSTQRNAHRHLRIPAPTPPARHGCHALERKDTKVSLGDGQIPMRSAESEQLAKARRPYRGHIVISDALHRRPNRGSNNRDRHYSLLLRMPLSPLRDGPSRTPKAAAHSVQNQHARWETGRLRGRRANPNDEGSDTLTARPGQRATTSAIKK